MAPLLSLDGIHKGFRRGRHEIVVLKDVSLNVDAGELVAVWGRRRVGKTTLLRVAAGLEPPDQGTVSFNGQDLNAAPRRRAERLRQEVVLLDGDGTQFHDMQVLDYVALPLLGKKHSPRAARRRAMQMLERLELTDCSGESWDGLTDHERTLVALANALIREPKLLIADNLGVNLDLLQRDEVMALLRQIVDEEDLGVLILVADMTEMLLADRIASLSDGRLTIAGGPADDGATVISFPAKRQSA